MNGFKVTYDNNDGSDKLLNIVQRGIRGGAIGDTVLLNPGESAEVTIESDGVQLTITEVPNTNLQSPQVEG